MESLGARTALVDRARAGDADALDELVAGAREGDRDAFDALVNIRLRPTYRLALAILGTSEEAEDATQDAFIATWRSLPTLRDPRRFDAWFGRIVVNACRMSVRRRARAVALSADLLERPDAGWDDGSVGALLDADALQRALRRLRLPHRTILALRHLEDRSMTEIGTILGIPVGTAKWRLHEARAALAREMEAEA